MKEIEIYKYLYSQLRQRNFLEITGRFICKVNGLFVAAFHAGFLEAH